MVKKCSIPFYSTSNGYKNKYYYYACLRPLALKLSDITFLTLSTIHLLILVLQKNLAKSTYSLVQFYSRSKYDISNPFLRRTIICTLVDRNQT